MSISRGYLAATSSASNGLPQPQILPPPVSSFTNFGYFGTGVINRIDYSNDTTRGISRGSLTFGRNGLSATGNSNFGYFAGGATFPAQSPVYSSVDRIEYSNDSTTATPRGVLTSARHFLASVGNQNFGYFAGGTPGTRSTVERIQYVNDTAVAPPRGTLSFSKYGMGATGNSNFGYFGGGTPFGSAVERINYSNDTSTSAIRGALSVSRYYLAATGNSNFGYFGGGLAPATSSVIDRVDYSNDTATASPRGPLNTARYGLAATGNSNFGYYIGGFIPGTPADVETSIIDRVDYSNDTVTSSPRGVLRFNSSYLAASSAAANGLPQ